MKVYYRKGGIKSIDRIEEVVQNDNDEIIYIKITNTNQDRLNEVAKAFDIDLRPFQNREDIEISSHYVDVGNQLTLNLSIPINMLEIIAEEESIHIVIKRNIVFVFISKTVDKVIGQLTQFRYDMESLKFESHLDFLAFELGIISDYYADFVEFNSNRIRDTYHTTMSMLKVSDNTLDLLTKYNFNNFLLRESVSEFQRIVLLLRKKYVLNSIINEKFELEINDLKVISEHIQYNFERVNDLKTNVNSKIELEQNRIFKTLTIITVCFTIPTLIAGIYGMNFKYMPELNYYYSYPIVAVAIILSFLLPLIYFKRKKWF